MTTKMTTKETAAAIKNNPSFYFKKAKKTGYICPICGSGTGGNGTGLSQKGLYFHCFNCHTHGDVFEFIGQEYGITDMKERFKKAVEIYNMTDEDWGKAQPKEFERETEIQAAPYIEDRFQSFIHQAANDIWKSSQAIDYLKRRGFTEETIKQFSLGLSKGSIIIPYNSKGGYYTSRNIKSKFYYKPKAEDAGLEPLYNYKELEMNTNRPLFITESSLCSISIMQEGGRCIALNGTGYRRFLAMLDDSPTILEVLSHRLIILCLDNDTAGEKSATELKAELSQRGLQVVKANVSGSYKDPNEALEKSPEQFRTQLNKILKAAKEYVKKV